MAAWSNAWACDCSLTALAGSNSIGVMNVLLECCVFSAVSTTGLSLVQGSRTECGVLLSLIKYNSNPLHLQWICRNSSEEERKKYFVDILIYLAVPVRYFVSSFQNQCLFFYFGATAPIVSRSPQSWGFYITCSDAQQSVGLLWKSVQLVVETSTWPNTAITSDKDLCPGRIWTHNLSRRAAAELRLWPRGHWDRKNQYSGKEYFIVAEEALDSVANYCCLKRAIAECW